MRLHHLALWSRRIELLRDFYTTYFDGHAGEKYENPAKGFESYFVTFADGVSLELMRRTDVTAPDAAQHLGLAHFAFGCESRADADRLRALVDALPARERAIMRQRYGFDGAPKTQQQTAQALHISRSYVSRLEKRALEYLRGRWPAE